MSGTKIRSVAIIGAGASGAITAAALASEDYFTRIRVFERKSSPGGTWIYDPDPGPDLQLLPGALPPETDSPLEIPDNLPRTTTPNKQERFDRTPIYDDLTTNVPDIAMSFSDSRFSYGPFAPHWVPRQYIANYFSDHRTDQFLVLNTTVEHLLRLPYDRWRLTLRRYDAVKHVDVWWEEEFDAVVVANGHYTVPYVPRVKGLDDYLRLFPGRVVHSKIYRNPRTWKDKKVVVIGNSASGHDVTVGLAGYAHLPVYQSRRSVSRWEGDEPPPGVEWKPVIKEFLPTGDIVFEDDSVLSDVDTVIYCTGYKPSFPFWDDKANGSALWNYEQNRLVGSFWHTFFPRYPTLGIVGIPRVLTFRSFEYQAIALARVFAKRNASPLPPKREQVQWDRDRWQLVSKERRRFHNIVWENGETLAWLRSLFELAGLPILEGHGRCPPVLNDETRWAIEHIRKYPEPGRSEQEDGDWTIVRTVKDILHFI